MKHLAIVLFTFFSPLYKAQIYNSSCTAHDTVVNFYLADAQKLNLHHIFRSNSTYKDSIALNRTITNNYLSALIAVYNATAMPARDSVINIFNIHCYNPGLHEVLFEADSNLQWMKNLRANIIPTGYSTIDSLITRHYLHLTHYSTIFYSPSATVILNSDTSFNTMALATFINVLPGVSTTAYDFRGGEGNELEDTVNTTFNWFRYTYGWDDCSDGCEFHKYWEFRVYNDCSVAYGGTYGNDLTVGIKTNQISFNNVRAYPNPTHDKLTVEGLPGKATLSLINVLGEVVYSDDSASINSVLDLGHYAPGIYYLKIKGDEGQRVLKIVKE